MKTPQVVAVEQHLVWVPTRSAIRWEMERARIHAWSEVEIIRVTLESGVVGVGETIQNYTWGRSLDPQQAIGRNPFDMMWDDGLGAGLQMALFDAAGKEVGVPVYRLLGTPCRRHCPISHWGHDMPPALYAQEAALAVERGYTSMKIKTRPWFDVHETLAQISAATPDHFQIDADWNDFLLSAVHGVPVLQELEARFPKLSIIEGPMPPEDGAGNREIMRSIALPIAHHYSEALARRTCDQKICDGFVMAGGVSRIVQGGLTAATFNMPFFLQMVGTGLTTAMATHLGAVLTHAQWPAITCMEIYEDDLIEEPIRIHNGLAHVSEAPGLGVELDMAAVRQYRARGDEDQLPARLVTYARPNGLKVHFADDSHNSSSVWSYFRQGNQPVYERGVAMTMANVEEDPELQALYAQARASGPVVVNGRE